MDEGGGGDWSCGEDGTAGGGGVADFEEWWVQGFLHREFRKGWIDTMPIMYIDGVVDSTPR